MTYTPRAACGTWELDVMFHPAVETRECQGDLSVAGKDQAGVIGFYSLMARWAQRLGFFCSFKHHPEHLAQAAHKN